MRKFYWPLGLRVILALAIAFAIGQLRGVEAVAVIHKLSGVMPAFGDVQAYR